MKKPFYTEAAYLLGLVTLALGTVMMEAADFGVSMVVAPAYVVYLKLSQVWSFFSFGMAEYLLQFTLLVLLTAVLRRFRLSYLFSFCTALLYGAVLDGFMLLFSLLPTGSLTVRLALYVLGMVVCGLGVSMLFHTYISPEAYELFVKEISARYGFDIHKTKTAYDCVSCAVAIVLSLLFFGRFEGVKLGTILCALINGSLISRISAALHAAYDFKDGLPLRRYFE